MARRDEDTRVLRKYLEDISAYPLLTPDQEKEYGRVVQNPEASDEDRSRAADALVNGNLRFVVSYAKRFHSPDVSFLDLINEGNIGLMHAARRFDPERGVKFITYAVWWIRQAISHALSEQGGAMRLPHKQVSLQARLSRKREELSLKLGRDPSLEEIAKEADVSVEDAEDLLSFSRSAESLSESFGSDQERTLGDLLEQTTIAAADEALLRLSERDQVRLLLSELPAKERAVLCRRFGISEEDGGPEGEEMTLQQIGDELHLSRERVRQIEAQAKTRLKRLKLLKIHKIQAHLN